MNVHDHWGPSPVVLLVSFLSLDMGISDDELLSAGMEGLVAAGHRYDASRGYKFATYGIDCDKCTDEEICDKLGLTIPSLLQIRCITMIKLRRKGVKYED